MTEIDRTAAPEPRRVTLALQGGGAHGAFTWGVLDRLLDEPDLEIEGVSGASAGAMNGAMLTTGLKIGGREEAKRRLGAFWGRVGEWSPLAGGAWAESAAETLGAPFSDLWSQWLWAFTPVANPRFNPAYIAGDVLSRFVSPYQFNPTGANPLRDVIEELIDFEKVCGEDAPRLHVSATDVLSGRVKVFQGLEISTDALLASACLPFLYPAVEIGGRAYWDGGYTGNPPIWPLIYSCASADVIVIHINPIERTSTPRDSQGILNRVNEISFNSNLMNEMRAIDTITRLLDHGGLSEDRYKRMRVHAIEDQETMRRFTVASKMSPDPRIIEHLFTAGHEAAARWLDAHKDKIGVSSSVDIRERYL